VSANFIYMTIVGLVFPYANEYTSLTAIFLFFCGCSVLGLIFIFLMVIETKGRPLEKVTELYY